MAATTTVENLDGLNNSSLVEEVAPNKSESYGNGSSSIIDFQEGVEAVPTPVTLQTADDLHDKSWMANESQRLENNKKHDAGVAYRNLTVYGFGTATDYQKTFANYPLPYLSLLGALFGRVRKSRIDILRDFEGLVSSGEMLLVLGRPGSGCTTFLKTLAGHTHGLYVDHGSVINYQGRTNGRSTVCPSPWSNQFETGIPPDTMHKHFRGECTYQPESDIHFPHLTVAQTLDLAAQARLPSKHVARLDRKASVGETRNAIVAALGLRQTLDTKVGNSFVRGISGGERKRTSIAEVLVGGSPLQCWDNSTRGLDSANALQFVQTLRLSTMTTGSVAIVTLYQASQEIYDVFDKVALLYEGRQIYLGPTDSAKTYFTNLGFVCPKRSSTGDFLCSLTNPLERTIIAGYESEVPRTPDGFARIWKDSPEREKLGEAIDLYETAFPLGPKELQNPQHEQKGHGFSWQCRSSPYKISYYEQVGLCVIRSFQRLLNDLPPLISSIAGNAIVSIILGSIFYNMPDDTSSFFGRGVLLFFTILTNTFLASFEGVQLWDQRPIVEKHFQYAFYRPSTEAIASMLCDLPNKLLLTAFFNIPFYFLANMRRTPAAFFTFYLFAFASLLTGSMLYRTIGAMSRTLTASIAPGADFILMLVIYTGFVLPIPSMHPWFGWFRYIDPVGYAFESLMVNEFSGRQFPCSMFIPQGPNYLQTSPHQKMCAVTGADPSAAIVEGTAYLATTFQYYPEHLWRNLGILFAIMSFLCVLYLLATEFVTAQRSKGEVLIFRQGQEPQNKATDDEEAQHPHILRERHQNTAQQGGQRTKWLDGVETRAATFVWDNLCYDVKVKGGSKRLLNNVEGWIQPGTLTALMGVSGAGKTTLLTCLANRASTGMISGEKVVDAKYQDEGFARKVGYAQQQDMNIPTTTVREALIFSARLRQPKKYSDTQKLAYVDEVIATLDLARFANAVIGVPGEGLNIEQRKRVTIGIELAARPELLLFLDEPTSGLDTNTAWSICTLLRKLADNGQAILCTIHQPSGTLFEMFDRLLFLQDGQSIYFGDIGPNSRTLIDYFHKQGVRGCGTDENPAEWLLDVTSHTRNASNAVDWPNTWQISQERQKVKDTLKTMKEKLLAPVAGVQETSSSGEYASSFANQLYSVTRRNFEHDWRTPSYLYSKLFLTIGAGLVNGFSFYKSENSLQGVQNQIFSVFLLFTLHSSLVQLIMPQFLENRALYESHERPSRTYSWAVFIISNIIAELPWQTVLAVLQFVTWYYPLGMYRNALVTDQLVQRGGLMFLTIWSYMTFSSTFSQMIVTIMPDAATGVNISALLYSLSLIFCGVLVRPNALPRFWIFMYRVTPVTYFINTLVSTGLSGVEVICTTNEILEFDPANGQDCGSYLKEYMNQAGGSLLNPQATQECQFCPVSSTDSLLAALGIYYEDRWRNFAITLVYSFVNVAGALCLYWLFRVPKGARCRNA
ncbi:MAG: hypothetical protein M1830_005311 [Pleopsidium flavum]|nr:MAG: hypothetical protein M1830_005311 [Pleopsidium flavum]